jgi:single-strand DNA-binding protein
MPRRKTSTAPAPKRPAKAPAPEAKQYPPDSVLTGRLTADPKLRHTASSGKAVATIRIAVQDTEPQRFINVVCWERTAEAVCEYLKKGRLIEVTGREAQRTYTAKDGSERVVDELVAFRVQFLSGRGTAPAAEKELS